MASVRFEWDPRKAAINRRKHGVSFESAATVFDDPAALFLADAKRSEVRIVVIGTARDSRVLFVVFVEPWNEVLRILTARKATPAERKRYEEGE